MNFRIAARVKSRIFLVNPSEVETIAACGNYVRLNTANGSHLVRGTISAYQQRLSHLGFVRVHRSTLVNISYVVSLEAVASGDYTIHLASGRSVTLSRTFRDLFFGFVSLPAQRIGSNPQASEAL